MRHFTVVDMHSSPEDFENYVFVQLLKHEPLVVHAVHNQDELALRRGDAPHRKFIFRIRETHHDESERPFFIVADEENRFARIELTNDKVTIHFIDIGQM